MLDKLVLLSLSQNIVEDAVRSYTESLNLRDDLVDHDAGNVEWQKGLAQVVAQLGAAAQKQGQVDLAKQHYQRSLNILQSLPDSEGERSKTSEEIIKLQGQLDALTTPAMAPSPDSVASP